MKYLFVFAQSHEQFSVLELSISEPHGFTIGFHQYDNNLDKAIKRPFVILMLDKEEQAHILAQRCILIKCVYNIHCLLERCLISSTPRAHPTRCCMNKTAKLVRNGSDTSHRSRHSGRHRISSNRKSPSK
ncbi:uncharacterized protein F5891DRAFT_72152 [Suillus fuscotomentosus]|uniref:tRNA (guanine(10)-N(2))-methyltransferase TRMT11 N-terminal domain-containing protein n=1 Tax=Suillus fuscotomentosus TaxID=1912939 RepID=A0AAD4HDR8_9AGAM|nr:uncharacterized protein F5891DRAFT_72152 [Suillus fuscotomentosus]KAG1892858.1 hypothetical protein F5891DRAFT_72152 [Suillus fuscotomentosus]